MQPAAADRPRRWEQQTQSKGSLRSTQPAKGAGGRQGSGQSQGGQDARLRQIFAAIGVLNRSYVEFGYQGRSTSNTFALWKDGWNGLLLDGNPRWVSKTDGSESNLHRAKITSRSIVRLFRRHGVPLEVDYVSIDIDSYDLWVLRALLGSEYRPRVLTVEYNSNFPWDAGQLAFPDPEVMRVPVRQQQWGGNCYMGSSAAALHAVAREHRYSVRRPRPSTSSPTSTRLDPLDPRPSTNDHRASTLDLRPSTLDPRPSTHEPRLSAGGRRRAGPRPLPRARRPLGGTAAARPRLAPRPLPPVQRAARWRDES